MHQGLTRLADILRGDERRVIRMPGVRSFSNGVAVSYDGSALLVSDGHRLNGSHAIHEFSLVDLDWSRLHLVGEEGDGRLQFRSPRQVWVAPTDVFVADCDNDRVQVLTPRLGFRGFIGVGQLDSPAGVCANDDVVVVSELRKHRITVFQRDDGAVMRRFGSRGSGNGQLGTPCGLCFMSGDRHIAVADSSNDRVCVFGIDGEFIRHVGLDVLKGPTGVACSAVDELVVADCGNRRVAVFRASGELLKVMGRGAFSGVAVHGGTVFAQDADKQECVVFQ